MNLVPPFEEVLAAVRALEETDYRRTIALAGDPAPWDLYAPRGVPYWLAVRVAADALELLVLDPEQASADYAAIAIAKALAAPETRGYLVRPSPQAP